MTRLAKIAASVALDQQFGKASAIVHVMARGTLEEGIRDTPTEQHISGDVGSAGDPG
jgi:hypothetical protein